jgi:protein SCO1/2
MSLSRRSAAIAIGGTTCAFLAALLVGWWRVDGPGAPRGSAPADALPLPFYDMDFQLTDHSGRKVGPSDWIGRPTLVFFGFTYCPDICPSTLSNISSWLEELGADASSRLQVAFVTVDPDRDSVEVMADYVTNFHPAIVGYTGSPEQILQVAVGFRARFDRVSMKTGYTMNHTASVFVFDARGKFVSSIDYHEPQENAVPKIRRVLI